MRFRAALTPAALFMVTAFVPCLGLAVSRDALGSQPHSRLFHEATERSSVSGKISVIGAANDTTPVEERLRSGAQATIVIEPTMEPTSLLAWACWRHSSR